MEEKELKEILLKSKKFLNNEYLNQYCKLIIQNSNQEKIKFQTQKHHIIPKCYFTLNNLEVDNSKENLVNLLYKDHILAHYYLCLCTEGDLQCKLANAFFHLVARKWKYNEFNPETDLSEYQRLYEKYVKERCAYTVSEDANSKRSASIKQFYSIKGPYKLTEQHKEKISFSMMGKARDDATKTKIASSWASKKTSNKKGKPMAQINKDKLSKILTDRKFSEVTIQRIKQNKGRPIICLDTNIIYSHITAAIKSTGIKSIGMCCNGQQNSAGGMRWAFADDAERIEFLRRI